ncbi:MAG: 2,5-diamino-6-(ribosylamino)-4(3H)-pyrimidinone 5'-phosphate reductase [Anaerolineae bacterium]
MPEPTQRPHVILNVAVSADGKTDTAARQGAAISSAADLERVDRLRAECDAVMVGGRTLLGDNPRLTVKSPDLRAAREARGLSPNPIKVGVMTKADLQLESRFLTVGPARKMLFTTTQTAPEQIARLRQHGAEVFVTGEKRVDLIATLARLKAEGIDRLLVEGGGTLNAELLAQGLVDELHIYTAPLVFGGATAPTFCDGDGLARADAVRLRLLDVQSFEDGGILASYQVLAHTASI